MSIATLRLYHENLRKLEFGLKRANTFQFWHRLRLLANDDVITDYLQSGIDLNMNLLCYQINRSIKFTCKVETDIKVYSYNLAVERKTHENLKILNTLKCNICKRKIITEEMPLKILSMMYLILYLHAGHWNSVSKRHLFMLK